MVDYALAVEESLIGMFLALCLKASDTSLPPLRVLLLERDASPKKGWFRRLLDLETGTGGFRVHDLFEREEPMMLAALNNDERRIILETTLAAAITQDGDATMCIPPIGANLGIRQATAGSGAKR